jgi:broad specificity phosphatase PhoE
MTNRNPPTNGFDKRRHQINRSGRPKSFDELRKLAQGMANEIATDAQGNPIIIDGHKATNSEMILRTWMKSKDARLQQAFVAYSWGKPPDETRNKNINFDVSQFSVTELEQIAAGADPLTVVANRLAAAPPAASEAHDITPDPDALDNE